MVVKWRFLRKIMVYKKLIEFWDVLDEEERLVKLLKIVKKHRENLIKVDLNNGNKNELLAVWKDYTC